MNISKRKIENEKEKWQNWKTKSNPGGGALTKSTIKSLFAHLWPSRTPGGVHRYTYNSNVLNNRCYTTKCFETLAQIYTPPHCTHSDILCFIYK